MPYVDLFVCPTKTDKKSQFIDDAATMAAIFKDHGALRIVDCWGTDVPDGKVTSFPLAVRAQDDETVCVSWAEWPSKEFRDAAMEKVMKDERINHDHEPAFDLKRMIFASFESVSEV